MTETTKTPLDRWIEALESGMFPQTKRVLHRDDGYCCLGVACEVLKEDVDGAWLKNDVEQAWSFAAAGVEEREVRVLPLPVQYLLGLRTAEGDFTWASLPPDLQKRLIDLSPKGGSSLATLNDGGVPFSVLIEVIRARPEGLFEGDTDV